MHNGKLLETQVRTSDVVHSACQQSYRIGIENLHAKLGQVRLE
jgi:hypothetical protein